MKEPRHLTIRNHRRKAKRNHARGLRAAAFSKVGMLATTRSWQLDESQIRFDRLRVAIVLSFSDACCVGAVVPACHGYSALCARTPANCIPAWHEHRNNV